jgi:hypothetical protein
VILYRAYPGTLEADPFDEGGPLYSAWRRQRGGRHDNPDAYPAFYASKSEIGCIAEAIQQFRGTALQSRHLHLSRGRVLMIATIATDLTLLDSDDPRQLSRHKQRPSTIATGERIVTQTFARAMHAKGHQGLRWWSSLEASWINVTLFMDRCRDSLRVSGVRVLTLEDAALGQACEVLGITRAP